MSVDLYLASSSPRRAALLQEAGFVFSVLPNAASAIDETPWTNEAADALVCRLANAKAQAALAHGTVPSAGVVLAGDTVVDLDGRVLGKPVHAADAARMLAALSGRSHTVHTALAVANRSRLRCVLVSTRVQFKPLSNDEITAYIATGEPLDKAGAYAIQGRAAQWVTQLSGSYGAVVGLPQYEAAELMAGFGIRPIWHNGVSNPRK